jgi:hypothetical protein
VTVSTSGVLVRRIGATLGFVGALTLAGCVSQDTKRDAINAINAAFRAEYDGVIATNGRRLVPADPTAAYAAAIAALVSLEMDIREQNRGLGYIQVGASAPRPLSVSEWERAAAADLPKTRELLRPYIGAYAELFNFDTKGIDTIITVTIIGKPDGAYVSLTMRLRETAPPTADLLPRRDYPPPTALRVGLDKIWAAFDRELKAQPRQN